MSCHAPKIPFVITEKFSIVWIVPKKKISDPVILKGPSWSSDLENSWYMEWNGKSQLQIHVIWEDLRNLDFHIVWWINLICNVHDMVIILGYTNSIFYWNQQVFCTLNARLTPQLSNEVWNVLPNKAVLSMFVNTFSCKQVDNCFTWQKPVNYRG